MGAWESIDPRSGLAELGRLAPARRDTAGAERARSSHRGCLVERIGIAGLDAVAAQWEDLSRRAAEPNVFYSHGFLSAALSRLSDAGGGEVAAVWRPGQAGDRLIGLFPVRTTLWRWGLPARLVLGLTHNYGPLGTPLLDAADGEAACEAFLDWARRGGLDARFLLLPLLGQDGPASAMLRTALTRSGLRCVALDRTERVLADRKPGGQSIVAGLSKKRRDELARQRRRLEDLGSVTLTRAARPDEAAEALEDFLRLEQGGWKGQAGTASSQRPDRLAFVREAVADLAAADRARIFRLALDGKAIAVSIVLLDAPRAWGWKIAYDESFARYSPGVQLMLDVTDRTFAEPRVSSIDSLADPSHPMIGHLWRDRTAVADWLIDLTPGGSPLGPLAAAGERLRRRLHAGARAAVHRLRGAVHRLRGSRH